MEELIIGVNESGSYLSFKIVNNELQNLRGITIDYGVMMNFQDIYGNIYESIIYLLTDKELGEFSQEYSKVKFLLGGTDTILYEKKI